MDQINLAAQIANLEKEVARLDASFGRVEFWLFVATILVVAGLVAEYWDEIRKLTAFRKRSRTGLNWPHPSETFGAALRAFVGGVLVTVGVGWELVEEIQGYRVCQKQNDANAQIVSLLTDEAAYSNKIAKQATVDAGKLGVSVSTLHDFVDTQVSQNNTAITELQHNTKDLQIARGEAVEAAAGAKDDYTKISALLKQEEDIHQQIVALTTPRTIDDAHYKALVEALRPFTRTPVDFGATVDNEKIALFLRISDAVAAAGWSIVACGDSGSIYANARPGFPNICEKTDVGVSVQISILDMAKLGAAASALTKALTHRLFWFPLAGQSDHHEHETNCQTDN